MQELMKAIMKKKRGDHDEIDKAEQEAMMGVLKDIHKMASDDMGHDIHGLKKVSVASNSKEGLSAGLDKAKNMLSQEHHGSMHVNDEDADESSADMHPESRRHQLAKHADMSDEKDGMADPHGDIDEEKEMHGYAEGGIIDHDVEHTDAPLNKLGHQSRQSKGFGTDHAGAEISKERDMKKVSSHQHSVENAPEMGTHGMHGDANGDDEYASLDHDEVEALIKHLQRYRKSSNTF